jgi:hypothetical protein
VQTKLEYVKPFAMTQDAEITIASNGPAQSTVTWRVWGQSAFMGRVMCFFMNMDKMVGGTFEKGLANLKAKVEAGI